jgi:hypothetical protein
MPIRIWNQPGGPVQWGEDWGFREKPMDMSEEEWQAYLAERQVGETPSGRLAGYGGGTLDMTGGNLAAKESILSRGSPFEGLSRQQYGDVQTLADQGLSPDEMTAMRLSRPRFETNIVEAGGREYPMTEMIEPSGQDLARSAAYWKIAGQPLEMRGQEADIEQAFAEAEARRGLGEQYRATAETMLRGEPVDQTRALDSFSKLLQTSGILDDPTFSELTAEQKLIRLRQMWDQFLGGAPEQEASTPSIGRMGSYGSSGAEGAVDELFR